MTALYVLISLWNMMHEISVALVTYHVCFKSLNWLKFMTLEWIHEHIDTLSVTVIVMGNCLWSGFILQKSILCSSWYYFYVMILVIKIKNAWGCVYWLTLCKCLWCETLTWTSQGSKVSVPLVMLQGMKEGKNVQQT